VTLKGSIFKPTYLSWRYTYEMSKFTPLFDIPLAKFDNMDEYPSADEIKRALEAHLVNHPSFPRKPTASATANNTTVSSRKRKRRREDA
jgi:hypothetical protein